MIDPFCSRAVLDYQKDFSTVFAETNTVVEWYILGSFLNVTQDELKRIKADHPFNCRAGLLQMLSSWLKSGDATWFSLVHALRKMGQSDLASTIAMNKGVCVFVCIGV